MFTLEIKWKCVCTAVFRHVEQSNLLMEQRSDSLKTSSHQSHTRLLEAEKDKVRAHWSCFGVQCPCSRDPDVVCWWRIDIEQQNIQIIIYYDYFSDLRRSLLQFAVNIYFLIYVINELMGG